MIDANHEFAVMQAVTVTAASTNVYDFGAANPNQGAGGWRARAVTPGNWTGTSPTAQASLQDSADNSAWLLLLGAETFAVDGAASVLLFDGGLPTEHRRYVRFNWTTGGTSPSGSINAYLYNFK